MIILSKLVLGHLTERISLEMFSITFTHAVDSFSLQVWSVTQLKRTSPSNADFTEISVCPLPVPQWRQPCRDTKPPVFPRASAAGPNGFCIPAQTVMVTDMGVTELPHEDPRRSTEFGPRGSLPPSCKQSQGKGGCFRSHLSPAELQLVELDLDIVFFFNVIQVKPVPVSLSNRFQFLT